MNIKREGESILLCCGKRGCPALKKSKEQPNHYNLSDDFGGEVSLTKEQLLAIKSALKELDEC
jgi:hypothetical protein